MDSIAVPCRTIALERQVSTMIRAGDLAGAMRMLSLAQHKRVQGRPVTFLDLPAELRNQIYNLSDCLRVVCNQKKKFGLVSTIRADIASLHCMDCRHDSGMSLIPVPAGMYKSSFTISLPNKSGSRTSYTHDTSIAQQPDLTRVCRQIRAETLPMFYGNNHFVLHSDWQSSYRRWFLVIGPANVALLRNVTLCLDKKPDRADWFRQTVARAKPDIRWLEEAIGRHANVHVAWFQHQAPYLDNIDAFDADFA